MRSVICCTAFFLLVLTVVAQDSPRLQNTKPQGEQPLQKRDQGGFTINVDVALVTLPVSVLDKEGRFINDLSKDHFQVYEDGSIQEVSLFKHEDIPLSLGLVIDNSGSMRNKRERVNSAALSLVRESNSEDETFIVNFDDEAYLEQDFTSNIGDLVDSLDHIDTRGETAMRDAVYLSIDHIRKEGHRDKRALLVITDGEDNKSKYGINKFLEHVREAKDVTIYAIGLLEENDDRGGLFHKSPSKKAKEDLIQLTEITGGQAFFPKSVNEVEDICKRIAHDLRNQYTVGYTPTNKNRDGSWRKVDVKVNPPRNVSKVTVHTKQGYYAPESQ